MGVEFELKYRATPEVLENILGSLDAAATYFEMRTTYYDTADRALSARRWTLRRRMENGISICTLKIPAAGGARGEFEIECDNIETALPELCKLSGVTKRTALTAKGLQEVCGARFRRTAVEMLLPGGAVVEVALDQGVLLGGGKEQPFCELEVELKSGDRAEVIAFGADLATRFGLAPEPQSKFRRAAILAGGN